MKNVETSSCLPVALIDLLFVLLFWSNFQTTGTTHTKNELPTSSAKTNNNYSLQSFFSFWGFKLTSFSTPLITTNESVSCDQHLHDHAG